MRNQRSNLLKKRGKYARRRRGKVADFEYHLGHASLRKSEVCGVIAPKDQYLDDISENAMYVDESQGDQGHHKDCCAMSPKNDTTIDLAVTSSSDQMKVVNTGYELV